MNAAHVVCYLDNSTSMGVSHVVAMNYVVVYRSLVHYSVIMAITISNHRGIVKSSEKDVRLANFVDAIIDFRLGIKRGILIHIYFILV